jgi:hypothetical protein
MYVCICICICICIYIHVYVYVYIYIHTYIKRLSELGPYSEPLVLALQMRFLEKEEHGLVCARSALRMQRLVHDVTDLCRRPHGQRRRLGCARPLRLVVTPAPPVPISASRDRGSAASVSRMPKHIAGLGVRATMMKVCALVSKSVL